MVTKTIDSYGTIIYRNEKHSFHREDGPGLEFATGTKYWYINSTLHRVDGPAIESVDGSKYYYIMDKQYSYEGWLAIKDFPLLW